MPTYYAPGRRKGNRTYTVRGRIDGRQYEIATDAANKGAAEDAWHEFKRRVREENRKGDTPAPQTFAQVADLYMDTRGSRKAERAFIEKLKGQFGPVPVADVTLENIARAANALYPRARNETKNRQAYAPAAAILHFAYDCELRDYLVVKKLKERQPETRRPGPGARDTLLTNTDGAQRAFLTFLFFQGWRVSEALNLDWDNVDLVHRKVRLYVSKSGRWKTVEMHDETFRVLANLPTDGSDRRAGRVFPWRTRWRVYDWLTPLCDRLKVAFTPHMARHEFAGTLREHGATQRDLVDVGTWTSTKSVERYDHAPESHARDVLHRLGAAELGGKTRGRKRNQLK